MVFFKGVTRLAVVVGMAWVIQACDFESTKRSESQKVRAVPLDQSADVAWIETKVVPQNETERKGASSNRGAKSRKKLATYSSGEIDKRMILEGAIVGAFSGWVGNCVANIFDKKNCKDNEGAALLAGVAFGTGAGYITAVKTAKYQSEAQRLSGLVIGARTELRAARDARKASQELADSALAEIGELSTALRNGSGSRNELLAKVEQSRDDLRLLNASVGRIEEQKSALQQELSKKENSSRRAELSGVISDLESEKKQLQSTIDVFLGTVKRGEAAMS